MSDSLDNNLPEAFRNRTAEGAGHSRPCYRPWALDEAGLLGTEPWPSIPLRVSNDRAEVYFEIY